MREKRIGKRLTYSLLCIFFACLFCGCESEIEEDRIIQLSVIQDILVWNEGVVWDSGDDILVKKNMDSEENSIFREPFYEKDDKEKIALQYIEGNQLYYIRTFENQYYELCCMDLITYENNILYTNCSEEKRKYNYLGIQDKQVMTIGEREDNFDKTVQQFCKLGNSLYLLIDDTLYRMNEWTKHKMKLAENIDSDSELVFFGPQIYFKNKDKMLMVYDLKKKTLKQLSEWMVLKICYSGENLLVQRMNGELYCYKKGGVLEKVFDETVDLLQGNEKYFYCTEQNNNRLVIYNADTRQKERIIEGQDIWGAVSAGDVIYYLESKTDHLALKSIR